MSKDSVQIVVDSLKYNSQIFEESREYIFGDSSMADIFPNITFHNICLYSLLVLCLFFS